MPEVNEFNFLSMLLCFSLCKFCHTIANRHYSKLYIGIMVSVCQWPGRLWFNPRKSHTKDSENGT